MKKLTIFLTAIATLIVSGASAGEIIRLSENRSGAILVDSDQFGLTLRIDIESIELQQLTLSQGEFVGIGVDGFARSQSVGEPNLPMINKLVSIPFGCRLNYRILDYEVEEVSLSEYGFTAPIIPTQPSLSKSQDPDDVPFQYDRQFYARPGYRGKPLASVSEAGIMRALRLGMISVAPVQYDPVANSLKIFKSVTVRVDYENPDWAETERMRVKYYSPYYETVYSRLINYQPPSSMLLDDLVRYPVTYVIISDRMFEEQLQPFVEWKAKKGFNVITAYTDEIGHGNTEIRNYIYNLYRTSEPPPSFVLLVGDDQQIQAFQFSGHISDLSFCEFTNDHLPEIYYGRFSAQNASQLQPQIDKTLEYEQYLMPDPEFLNEVTMIAGVDPTFAPTYGNGQINYGTINYFNEDHGLYSNTWLYPRSDEPGASAAIIQTVNDGVSFINYTAHGSHDGWADPVFGVNNINSLQNAGRYPLAVGNCCLTNTFGDDYSTPCAGEAWLQAPNKGAVGYIGASDNTYWDEDYWWGVGYGPVNGNGPSYEETGIGAYDGVFHDHGEPLELHYMTNDAMLFCGNMAVTESGSGLTNYYWEAYHLMGDPSVMTYMGLPAENAVDHPEIIILGESSITVYADPFSYVGLSMNGVLHGTVFVDESGSATLDFTAFDAPGSADFVVTAQNRQPYIGVIPVIAPSGPYVVYESCTINDINGNDDGRIDFGENILLGMCLVNVGPDPAHGVFVNLHIDPNDPYVTMTDTLEVFGDIEGNNGSVSIPDAFAFEVAENVPDGYSLDFALLIYSVEDYWESGFSLDAHAPDVAFSNLEILETNGNGNGIFEAGETVEVTVTLVNGGSSLAESVGGVISTDDEFVTIDDGNSTFGDIQPNGGIGDNSSDVFVVTADEDFPIGYSVLFSLSLTAEGGYACETQFPLSSIESFEYSDGGWVGEGIWQWGVPTSGPGSAFDGEKVWATNLSGQYGNNVDDFMSTAYYTVESDNARISFYHWYSFESTYDGGNVKVSTDAGATWEIVDPVGGYPDPDVVGLDNEPGFSGDTGGWQEVVFELGAYNGSAVQLGFRFGSDGSITRDGWYIDAVTLQGIRSWQGDPNIAVDPASFYVTLQQGANTSRILTISNEGTGLLVYGIRPITVGLRLGDDPDDHPDPIRQNQDWGKHVAHRRDGDRFTVTYDGPKLESPIENSDPPVITDFGGPDDFGYVWIDSDEPGGPVFQWVDITGIGEPLSFTDDQNQGPFQLGFDMPFYDGSFNTIRICSNGWLSFSSTGITYSNAPIPNSSEPNNLVAPFWDDLNPSDGGMIYYYTNNVDSAIVAWIDVPRFSDGGAMTFEAILTASGNITCQYLSMQGTLNSCTVGIENSAGNDGLQVVYNNAYVADELALKFVIPIFWLGVDPASGFETPGESSEITVSFDASELTEGLYTGYLRISSNDPVDPIVAVECTLSVEPQIGVDDEATLVPESFALRQNYPNPFNPTTTIAFDLPSAQRVTLKIYDLLGRETATPLDGDMPAGSHRVEFDASSLASGVYFYMIEAGDFKETKRMVLIK